MSALIRVASLFKRFRVPVKSPGLYGALKHLVRPRYEERVAVGGIDLEVRAGESVAYVGPNGAGKSTTLKMLSGVLRPTSGTIEVGGIVPYVARKENARQIGVVFGHRSQLLWDLPVKDSLRLIADIYSLPEAQFRRSFHRAVDLLSLELLLERPARTLSLGERMRCDLAASLLHEPRILYLDEPTLGLDLIVRDRVRAFVREVHQQGVTIVLTSHDIGDIEKICDRLVLIDGGRIAYDGPIVEIVRRLGKERIVHLALQEPDGDAARACTQALEGLGPSLVSQPDPMNLKVEFSADELPVERVIGKLIPIFKIADLHIERPGVEHVLRKLYGSGGRAEGS